MMNDPWPWHVASWLALVLGLALAGEAWSGPAADPLWAFVGVVAAAAGLLGVGVTALAHHRR